MLPVLALVVALLLGGAGLYGGWLTPSESDRGGGEAVRPSTVPAALEAAEDYYLAVDREDWDYTYENLGARTRRGFTREEWRQKNQWYADNEDLELKTVDVGAGEDLSGNVVEVVVRRTFKDGTSLDRKTFFVREGRAWRHRFSREENAIFMPDTPFRKFVEADPMGLR